MRWLFRIRLAVGGRRQLPITYSSLWYFQICSARHVLKLVVWSRAPCVERCCDTKKLLIRDRVVARKIKRIVQVDASTWCTLCEYNFHLWMDSNLSNSHRLSFSNVRFISSNSLILDSIFPNRIYCESAVLGTRVFGVPVQFLAQLSTWLCILGLFQEAVDRTCLARERYLRMSYQGADRWIYLCTWVAKSCSQKSIVGSHLVTTWHALRRSCLKLKEATDRYM